MNFPKTLSTLGCIAALFCSQVEAQEAETTKTPTVEAVAKTAVEATAKVANTEDGVLRGNVFTEENGEKRPVSAKMTLTSDGVVVDSVEADEEGSFVFQGIEAGSYQLLGSADGYVGGQAYDVQPFAGDVGGCSSCSLGLQSNDQPFASNVYEAPASACGSCNTCGGGGLGGGGGGGGLLGGGVNTRRLFALGAVGGIIAVAVSDDDDDDDVSASE